MGTDAATTVGRRDLLAQACDDADDLVLVARLFPNGSGRCLAANRRFRARFAGGEDVEGRDWADLLPATTTASLAAAARTALREGTTVRRDLSIAGAGDASMDAVARVAVLDRTEDGAVVSVTVTDRTLVGEATAFPGLVEANQHLRAENRELVRSNLDLDQFAYVASHDLVEPLRMVTSYLDLLSGRYADNLDEQARRYIGFAVDGAVRMRALVDDLLTLARVSSAESRIEDVDLEAVVRCVTEDLGVRIGETGASVRTGPLPVVRGDAGQLTQALTNLVGNALKFGRPDLAPVVTVSAVRTDHGWRVTVSDNGIGVRPEFRSQVFDMFRRLHPRTAYPGTGMGLAIAKKVVERHGGEIAVGPTEDGGSAFWFTLPDDLDTETRNHAH
jgi:signal transduction histidine kinase